MLKHSGFSLIEIVISLLILSLLLLGFDAMQVAALRAAAASYYFSVASQQMKNLNEYFLLAKRINQQELNAWNEQNKNVLPEGEGFIKQNERKQTVFLHWGKKTFQECKKNKIGRSGCITMELL